MTKWIGPSQCCQIDAMVALLLLRCEFLESTIVLANSLYAMGAVVVAWVLDPLVISGIFESAMRFPSFACDSVCNMVQWIIGTSTCSPYRPIFESFSPFKVWGMSQERSGFVCYPLHYLCRLLQINIQIVSSFCHMYLQL